MMMAELIGRGMKRFLLHCMAVGLVLLLVLLMFSLLTNSFDSIMNVFNAQTNADVSLLISKTVGFERLD
jgi:hypothetical protein